LFVKEILMLLIFISIRNSREDSVYRSRESSIYSRGSSCEREKSLYERGRSRTSRLPVSLERRDSREWQERRREKNINEKYYRDFRNEKRSKRRSESREIRETRNQEGNFTRKKNE
jgi:hypothetical protein